MDIRNFITFNTIVKKDGFTKAAESLNYAQSTVTMHIKELEEHYGEKLFDRLGKKIHLTNFGKQLYNDSRRLEVSYQDILRLSSRQTKTSLRIGVYESILKYRLLELISEFKKSHEFIDIIIEHGTCNTIRKKIREGTLDLGFQLDEKRNFTDLISLDLCEDAFTLIYPKDKMISNSTIYFTEKDCSYRRLFEQYLDDQGIVINQMLETTSPDLIKQYVSLGLGFSMVPSVTLTEEDKKSLITKAMPMKKEFYSQLVYHKDKSLFPEMIDFINLLKKYAADW